MQQWICHIQGLENIFGAREVEKIGRQIDGVEDLSVDFVGETLVLKADSSDVFKRLERTLALSGYRLLKKGYYVSSVVHVPDLGSDDTQDVVRKIIGSHTRVRKLDIRPLSKLVYLTHDVDFSITSFLCDLNNQNVMAHLRNQSFLKSRWQTFAHVSVMFAALLFVAAILIQNFYPSLPYMLGCYVSSLVITGVLLAKRAITQLTLHRKLTYVFLMLVVIIILMTRDLWFEASLLALSLSVSFMFEERAAWKLKKQWSFLKSVLPRFAFVKQGQNRKAIPASKVKINDVLIVNEGEYVPVDGEIIHGYGVFDTNNIIAKSDKLELKEKEKVFAGLKLESGSVEMKVLKTTQESVVYLLLKRMENSQSQITPRQEKASIKLDYMLYVILFVSSILLAIQYMPEPIMPEIWFEKALSLLVIAGSAFVLTSMQFSHLFSCMYVAKNGIYFYESSIWQDMVKVKSLVLDKAGVITNNKPEVQEVISLTRYSIQDILSISAGLAKASGNERFKPLVKRAENNNVSIKAVDSILDSSYKFAKANIDGEVLILGSHSAIDSMGLITKEISQKLKRWQEEGENVFLLADEKRVLGMITVIDPIRDEVAEFVDFSHHIGFDNVLLMASDNKGTNEVIAHRYGFDEAFPDLSSNGKEKCLAGIAEKGVVLSMSSVVKAPVDGVVSVYNNALESGDITHNKNQIISLGKNILLIPYLLQLAKKLDSRLSRLLTLLINVKVVVLVAILANFISLDQVIIVEFLLAIWVMSSTFKPKNMFEHEVSVNP